MLRLPFTVLIRTQLNLRFALGICWNAPITVYGIDTRISWLPGSRPFCWNAPITVYGIDTVGQVESEHPAISWNAPITVYGILKLRRFFAVK